MLRAIAHVGLCGLALALSVACGSQARGPRGGSGTTGGASSGGATGADGGAATGSSTGGHFRALSSIAGQPGGPGTRDGTGAAARFSYPAALALDGAGNLYVADTGNDAIRVVAVATGVVTTLAGSPGAPGSADGTRSAARFFAPDGLALDGAGNLYVADTGNDAIRVVAVATGAVTTLAGAPGARGSADGTGAAARFAYPQGLALDGAGSLYVADSGNDTIRRIVVATGAVTTLAGSPGARGSADGTGTAARFFAPDGLALDGAGNLYVADRDNDTIRKVALAAGAVTTLAGSPGIGGGTDGTRTAASFFYPGGLALDGAGNLYVGDTDNDTIRSVAIATGVVTTLAGAPEFLGSADGTGAAARFGSPEGLALDGAGNLYVADTANVTIRKIGIASRAVTTLAGSPRSAGSTDGVGTAARFHSPEGLALDDAGSLFVADTDNSTIRAIAVETGEVTTLAGSPRVPGSADGTGAAATFASPTGLALDGAGTLYVADTYNDTIRTVAVGSRMVATLAGSARTAGSADGTGTAARFGLPRGLALDGTGNLYVADTDNDTIRVAVVATGAVATLAGSPGIPGSADGTGAAARFRAPEGLALDGAGSLFVADTGNDAIRVVAVATGAVTTLAGSPGLPGSTDGTGAAARFHSPEAIALDGAGDLYVADQGNSTVRRIALATASVSTVIGTPGQAGVLLAPLPAGLNGPSGLTFGPGPTLSITDSAENAILSLH